MFNKKKEVNPSDVRKFQKNNEELALEKSQNYKKYKDLRGKFDQFIENYYKNGVVNIEELNALEQELAIGEEMLKYLEGNYKDFAQMYANEPKDDFYKNDVEASQEIFSLSANNSSVSGNNNLNIQGESLINGDNSSVKLGSDLRFSAFKQNNPDIFKNIEEDFPYFSKLFQSVVQYEEGKSKILSNASQLQDSSNE